MGWKTAEILGLCRFSGGFRGSQARRRPRWDNEWHSRTQFATTMSRYGPGCYVYGGYCPSGLESLESVVCVREANIRVPSSCRVAQTGPCCGLARYGWHRRPRQRRRDSPYLHTLPRPRTALGLIWMERGPCTCRPSGLVVGSQTRQLGLEIGVSLRDTCRCTTLPILFHQIDTYFYQTQPTLRIRLVIYSGTQEIRFRGQVHFTLRNAHSLSTPPTTTENVLFTHCFLLRSTTNRIVSVSVSVYSTLPDFHRDKSRSGYRRG